MDPAEPDRDLGRRRGLAAALVLVEALAPLAGAVVYAVVLATDEVVVRRNVVLLIVMGVALGAGLLAVARGLRDGRRGARSPAVTWQLLLGAVGCYVVAAEPLVGAGVVALAVLTLVAVLRATPADD